MGWDSVASSGVLPITPLPPITATSLYSPSSYAASVVSEGYEKGKASRSTYYGFLSLPSKFDMTTPSNVPFIELHGPAQPSNVVLDTFSYEIEIMHVGDHSHGSSSGASRRVGEGRLQLPKLANEIGDERQCQSHGFWRGLRIPTCERLILPIIPISSWFVP
jgi:hypothetical protein